MSDAVTVQLVATVGVVLVALLGLGGTALTVFGSRLLKRVKVVQGQVQNDHTSNLRDDIDGKHSENRSILLTIQRDVAWLMRRAADTDDRLDHLETTTERQRHETDQPRPGASVTRRDLRHQRIINAGDIPR